MRLHRRALPLILIASGLIGIGLLAIGEHYQLPIIPTGDFAKGLLFGICLGAELLGGMILLKPKIKGKARPAG